ncbi:MAG: nicotinate (nicotinamide) nucleotide adenylyltransferase [Gemmatimonadetes bacterium]|nr:nicotinate (nicotinamide) nucleotide adenylyltransferase [Gemmatimonadota bacterium]
MATPTSGVRKVGIFGGTFDPPHVGHLAVAKDAMEALGLERVLLVPAVRSPFKSEAPAAPAPTRLRMIAEAVSDEPRFEVCDLELRREAPSYTVDTLARLSEDMPGIRLVLLLGVDQWAGFGRWRRPREIARLAEIAVLTRSGERPGALDPELEDGPPIPFIEVPVTRIDLSSTEVRNRVREGRSARWLVPEAVRRIIEAEKLYL